MIATDHGGNRDFCKKAGAYLVRYTLKPLLLSDYVEAQGQVWAEPDIDDAAHAMRQAYARRGKRKITPRQQQVLDELFSARAVGERYRQRLEEILGVRV